MDQMSKSNDEVKFFARFLNVLMTKFDKCGRKVSQAAKFIDFFVHDILDYTILNRDKKNFRKDITEFSIKEAIQEILEIQEDKANMKEIDIKTQFKGFVCKENPMIRSDKKRI